MRLTYFIPAITRKMITQTLVLLFEFKKVPYTHFKQLPDKTPIRANRINFDEKTLKLANQDTTWRIFCLSLTPCQYCNLY